MKKWLIIGLVVAIAGHFGWFLLGEHLEKKGIPKSHMFGYLIYGDRYIKGVPSHMAPALAEEAKNKKREQEAAQAQAEKKAEQEQTEKPKTPEIIEKEYAARMKKAISDQEKTTAQRIYYEELFKIERDASKREEYRKKYINLQAKEYAQVNADILYKSKLNEYNTVKKKIATYEKNGVRPPIKLKNMIKNKPDKKQIYLALYNKEKARLTSATK
ncbi:MAG: hypothetical protein GF384_03195 [Elusimicrobia bacterium]|nr:hypothetical protein [Elusimicrobiota bacterium]MBD3411932.1 hypothetical protein [Elusimicrobiota bacterium]